MTNRELLLAVARQGLEAEKDESDILKGFTLFDEYETLIFRIKHRHDNSITERQLQTIEKIYYDKSINFNDTWKQLIKYLSFVPKTKNYEGE